jgi:hypothetical protein
MTEPRQCFEYLIEKAKKLPALTAEQRKLILNDLNYFLKQSLTNHDRRNKQEVIRNNWLQFQRKTRFTQLLLEPQGFFAVIQDFTGHVGDTLASKNEQNEFDKWEPPAFFEDLLKEFETKKHFFSKEEESVAFCGLKFLMSESKTPKMNRDEKGILKTWRSLKPVLEKYGFFYKYNGATILSSRLKLFLTGSYESKIFHFQRG